MHRRLSGLRFRIAVKGIAKQIHRGGGRRGREGDEKLIQIMHADEVIREVLLKGQLGGAFFLRGMASFFRNQHRDDLVAVAAVDAEIRVQRKDRAVPVQFGEAHKAGIGQ